MTIRKLAGALAIVAIASSLQACQTAEAIVQSFTTTTPTSDNATAAAENLYTVLAYAGVTYIKTAHPNRAVKTKIADLDNAAYAEVVAMRDAVAKGNSPAVAAALTLLNSKNADLSNYLASIGVGH